MRDIKIVAVIWKSTAGKMNKSIRLRSEYSKNNQTISGVEKINKYRIALWTVTSRVPREIPT